MNAENTYFAMGNEAITEGAIAAGARFYAGYPITPSSEIAELSSIRLPQVGGMYVQMEDEIGSIAAVIGASASGKKAYTATSGPGFSLMQESLGVAIIDEVPCVIIDVQRSGPSTGLATKPAQADVMQSRWGTHGDHGMIVLSPCSVQECYDLTIEAFYFSERFRTPVVLLADEVVGHMREKYVRHPAAPEKIAGRKQPSCAPEDYKPFNFEPEPDGIAPLALFGGKYIFHLTSTMHDETGEACGRPENAQKFIRHYVEKFETHYDEIVKTKEYALSDAEIAVIAFGCSVRPALYAMKRLRKRGIKAGVLQLSTIWPFADRQVGEVCRRVRGVVVPEMNLGQVLREVQRVCDRGIPVLGVNKLSGEIIFPDEIIARVEEVIR